MTTIDTVEDLVRILEEKPEWLDRIRSLILTDELLRLPQRFDQLAGDVHTLTGQVHTLTSDVHTLTGEFHDFAAETNSRLSKLEAGQDRLESGQDRLERRVNTLVDAVGVLKGAHAVSVAERDYEAIAIYMGFVRATLLSRADILRIGMSPVIQYRGRDELRSFRRADIIMEAFDAADEKTYIAVEVSYTVDQRDTSRAIRNAEILTEVKGLPALSAVCGLDVVREVEGVISSGDVYWHQFDNEYLAPR